MTEPTRESATRGLARVALVTCAELPDLDPDDAPLRTALERLGVATDVVAWDDPAADWAGYHLVLLRSTWDYPPRREEFVRWAATVPRLANPADVVAWNTDKRYLAELAAAGVPVVPTGWVAPGDPWTPPTAGPYVVKPAVSAGSRDTGRYDPMDPDHDGLARDHVRQLQRAGRVVMVQPYLPAVDTDGETALLWFGAADPGASPQYSHAARKGPLLTGPHRGMDGLYVAEEISPRTSTPAQQAVGRQALAAVPGGADRLLYARVDLIAGPAGTPLVVELELTEPSLFLGTAAGATDRFAAAIAVRASTAHRGHRP